MSNTITVIALVLIVIGIFRLAYTTSVPESARKNKKN